MIGDGLENEENVNESKNSSKRRKRKKQLPSKKGKFGQGSAVPIEKYNDAMWYAKNAAMLADAASYSYNSALGSLVDFKQLLPKHYQQDSIYSKLSNNYRWEAFPGVLAVRLGLTIGHSDNSTSPANLAAQNIYSFVRYKNSGAKNYDQADLMLYLLAMDSIYSLWNHLKRLYGLASRYSQYNKYMPDAYFYACGVSKESVINNLADFRLQLNTYAARITSFCVPGVMTYFVRHSWLFSNVYKDSDTLKAQQYMFVPAYFYKYDETGSQYGGRLVTEPMPNAIYSYKGRRNTINDLFGLLERLLNKVAYSEDIGVMSGDILKAYGEGALIKLSPVEPDYTVEPVYVEEVLNQIHNSWYGPVNIDASAIPTDYSQFQITQDPNSGYLICKPAINAARARSHIVLNMPWQNVTPDNTMVGTRLTCGTRQVDDDTFELVCGSEVVISFDIINIYRNNAGEVKLGVMGDIKNWIAFIFDLSVPNPSTTSLSIPYALSLISNFDWHPLLYIADEIHSDGSIQRWNFGIIGDISNYTIITSENLYNLHQTALMSQFNIPQDAAF